MTAFTPATALPQLSSGPEFTTKLSVPRLRQRVSAIIATYNRCPIAPGRGPIHDNPLTWALDSLLAQRGDALDEIVVVNDGSTDHTREVLDGYRDTTIPVRVVPLDAHRGTGVARNAGVAAARGSWLLFADDDCVCAPHYALGAAHTFDLLQHQDPQVAALNLPFYYRAAGPREVRPRVRIGRVDLTQGVMSTGFHTWPKEYGRRPPLLGAGVVTPFPVEVIGGTALVDAVALRRGGGFVDLGFWRTAYADHLYLSAALADVGATMYHCPDPRLSAVHLKFGAVGSYHTDPADCHTVLAGLGRPLGDLIDVARRPRRDTGARVDDETLLVEMIGSFFAFYTCRAPAAGRSWARRLWAEFVEQGQVYTAAIAEVPPRHRREEIWREGLSRAAEFLTRHTPALLDDITLAHVLAGVDREAGDGLTWS